MPKQSSNRVKLNKEFKSIGRIPMSALHEIEKFMELPSAVQIIRANVGNTVKHNHKHIDELEEQLSQLGFRLFGKRNKKELTPLFFSAVAHAAKPLARFVC